MYVVYDDMALASLTTVERPQWPKRLPKQVKQTSQSYLKAHGVYTTESLG